MTAGPAPAGDELARVVEAALAGLDLSFESPQPGAYLVRLEGQHRLAP